MHFKEESGVKYNSATRYYYDKNENKTAEKVFESSVDNEGEILTISLIREINYSYNSRYMLIMVKSIN
ncbi:MAG: hypothetical protein GX660_25525 [Clostridiaceae bacterium]|nr:hypothetical protein [Clostridiaceae bacterium]